ncbi:MAG: ABC transporter substrate-binding protein, partial [Acidimicrobiia bacterium]
DDTSDEPTEEPAEEPTEEPAEEPTEEPAEEPTEEPAGEIDLASVCPSPIVIQTDWFPESEHGALYQMVGEGYTVDTENLIVTGPLWASGPTPTGIDIEVRTGGPAIGFNSPRVNMYTDDSIHLGYSSFDAQAAAMEDTPLVSVIAPLEKNPQIIMWDAEAWPEVETIADLGEASVTVNVFAGGGFADYFVAAGIWNADQVDPSYDGSPARFIAEGNIAQQGFASAEPYNYEFVFEEFGKRPAFQLLHDAGYESYSQTLGVKPDVLEELRPCLEQFVPIVQQSIVDFANDPARANAVIIDAVAQFDSFWTYDEGVANYAVETMTELGLHGNGPDSTVGNMDEARVQKVIDDARLAGVPVPDDLVAADMFTNEFIDESIGF